MTQKQAQPAPLLRGEREPARGRQIGRQPILRELPDHRRHAAGLQGFFHCPERVSRGGRPHRQKSRGSEPEEIAAQSIKRARLESGEILLHPNYGTVARNERCEGQRKTARRSAVERCDGRQLVQFSKPEPALKRRIGCAQRKQRTLPCLKGGPAKGFAWDHFLIYVLFSFLLIPRLSGRVKRGFAGTFGGAFSLNGCARGKSDQRPWGENNKRLAWLLVQPSLPTWVSSIAQALAPKWSFQRR